jgi:hypothetical protein
MDHIPLRQTQARRLDYCEGVKQRLYLGLFIVTGLANLVYQLFT